MKRLSRKRGKPFLFCSRGNFTAAVFAISSQMIISDERRRLWKFLHEMTIVEEAVYHTFKPDKLNYELLGAGSGVHMRWHLFPRRKGDTETGGSVWKLGSELIADEFLPAPEELDDFKTRFNGAGKCPEGCPEGRKSGKILHSCCLVYYDWKKTGGTGQ